MQTVQSTKKFVSRYIHEDENFWKKHQLDFSASGLTRAVYCKTQAINYDRFGYWIRKLNSSEDNTKNDKQTSHKPSTLLPVQVKSECIAANTIGSLLLKNGLTLQIHDRQALSFILEKVMS